MSEKITAERVEVIAAAARIPLAPGSAERIANGIAPAAQRFAAENIALAMEIEPATYAAIARRDTTQ